MKTTIEKLLPKGLLQAKNYYLVVTDLTGHYLYVNEAFKKHFSFFGFDLIGKHTYLTIYVDDIERCNKAAMECIANPNNVAKLQLRKPINLNGDFNWSYWEFSMLNDKDNKPIGILGVGHDITEFKKNKTQLKNSENILSAIYNTAINAIIFVNTNLEITYYNNAAYELSKKKFASPLQIGANYIEIAPTLFRDEIAADFNEAKKGAIIQKDKFDDESWFRCTQFPVYNNKGELVGIAVEIRDISEQKKAEIRILEQNRKLKNIAWRESHELRKHLANILGIVNIIKEEMKDSNTKSEFVDYLGSEASNLDNVIRKIVNETVIKN